MMDGSEEDSEKGTGESLDDNSEENVANATIRRDNYLSLTQKYASKSSAADWNQYKNNHRNPFPIVMTRLCKSHYQLI